MNAPLKKIAVIITVYNRREKTLECLRHLFAQDNCGLQITVYLTDDGSTDGTGDEVRRLFPQVVVSRGNGSLFWTGGMNLSWELAMKSDDYDGYLAPLY
jgi:GT2 family glycosyltransferase